MNQYKSGDKSEALKLYGYAPPTVGADGAAVEAGNQGGGVVDFYTREPIPQQGELFDEVEPDSEDVATMRAHSYKDMVVRCGKALKWIEGEIAICNNVYPKGHSQRKKKMGERRAVERLLQDCLRAFTDFADNVS